MTESSVYTQNKYFCCQEECYSQTKNHIIKTLQIKIQWKVYFTSVSFSCEEKVGKMTAYSMLPFPRYDKSIKVKSICITLFNVLYVHIRVRGLVFQIAFQGHTRHKFWLKMHNSEIICNHDKVLEQKELCARERLEWLTSSQV